MAVHAVLWVIGTKFALLHCFKLVAIRYWRINAGNGRCRHEQQISF